MADESSPPSLENPWPVGMLSAKMKAYVERLGTAWVEGEITQWGLSGGTVYGKLRDLVDDVTVSFSVWSSVRARVPVDLKQGDRVLALVKPSYWLKTGSLSLQVIDMRHVGIGDLLEKLERLRTQLRAEGLFDESRKKRLPFLPRVIGLITGKDSDAEKDVLRNAQLRWPSVTFRVAHAAVQGDNSAREIIGALRRLDSDPEVDVIIVARGGGDFQNLLSLSDERVVRAAAECVTPLVSAIGHEADRPLLDDVADLRASTPTDAAKRVVPDVSEELSRVSQARARMRMRLTSHVSQEVERLGNIRSRPVLAHPAWMIDRRADELTRVVLRGVELMSRRVDRAHSETADSLRTLRALSPLSTMERGYSIVQSADGSVVRDSADAPAGSRLRVRFATGAVDAVSEGDPRPSGQPRSPDDDQAARVR